MRLLICAQPLIPENATVTETVEILSDFDFMADPATVRNVIIADTLLPEAQFSSADPAPIQSGSDLIWNLGDIPPLDTVTATLEIDVPASVADFISLDSGAAAYGSLKGREVNAQAAAITLAPDQFAPYLRGTVDADIEDEYMLQALAEVGSDPADIFQFVQEMGFEVYLGSLRGTRGTLWSEAGNSVDQASLLIAMLRASGVPARYAHGTLGQTDAQALILSMFPETVSVVGNIPAGSELADPANDPELLNEVSDHWWVQAYINGRWTDLDPSFRESAVGQAFTSPIEDDLAELPDLLRHKVNVAVKVEQYSTLSALTPSLSPTIIRPLEATFNSVELVGTSLNFYQIVESKVQGGLVFTTINHNYVPVFTLGDNDAEIIGETYQDLFSSFAGGLGNRFSTALFVEIENASPNGETERFEREIIDLIGPAARRQGGSTDLAANRGDTQQPYVSQNDVFQLHAITQLRNPSERPSQLSQELIQAKEQLTELFEATSNLNDGNSSSYLNDNLEFILSTQVKQLQLIVENFISNETRTSETFSNATLSRNYPNKPKLVLLSQGNQNDRIQTTFELLNYRDRVVVSPEQSVDAQFSANYFLSTVAKAIEFDLLSNLTGEESVVSALNVLTVARANGIPTVAISRGNLNVLNRLSISDEAKARITTAAQENQIIIVPETAVEINGQPEIGWMSIDQSGYATYVMEDGTQAAVAVSYLSVLKRALDNIGEFIGFYTVFVTYLFTYIAEVIKTVNEQGEFTKARVKEIIDASEEAAEEAVEDICGIFDAFGEDDCEEGAEDYGFPLARLAVGYSIYRAGFGADPPLPSILISQFEADPGEDIKQNRVMSTLTANATLSGSSLSGTASNRLNTFLIQQPETLSVESNGQTTQLTLSANESLSAYSAAVADLGIGLRASTNETVQFLTNINAQLSNGHLMVGESGQSVTFGGQSVSSANGFAVANFNGTVGIQSLANDLQEISLNGTGVFFSAAVVPESSTINSTQTAQFDFVISSSISEQYTLTVDAPLNWQVSVDSTGLVSATPDPTLPADDYPFLVTAQSTTYPELFISAAHQVTLQSIESVEVSIVPDPLITIPMGERLNDSIIQGDDGHVENGQAEISGAAYKILLENISSTSNTYQLDVSGLPAGWSLISGAGSSSNKLVTLASGQAAEVGLYVVPTNDLLPPAGESYNIQITATSTTNGALSDTASINFTMPATPFPYLNFEQSLIYAVPDSTVDINLSINNVGNTAGSFAVDSSIRPDIYIGDVYSANITPSVSPTPFTTNSIAAGSSETQTLTVNTSGAVAGEQYVVESEVDLGEYSPSAAAYIQVVAPEALEALKAAEQLGDLNDEIGEAYGEEVADAINRLAGNLCDPEAKNDLIDVLTAFAATLESGPSQAAILDIAQRLSTATTPTECADLLTELGSALSGLVAELEIRALYPYSLDLTPGSSGALIGEEAIYTVSINNQGGLATTYELTLNTPSGQTISQLLVDPNDTSTIDIPVSSAIKSFYNISAETVVLDGGQPITLTTQSRTAGFNVVDRFVDVLAVYTEPNFVEVGGGPAELSVAVANVINTFQPAIAATSVISPDGTLVFSSTLPINITTGVPQIYTLSTVDTSLLSGGIYSVAVELRDSGGQLIPDGLGIGYLGVGQSLMVDQEVLPGIVPPGDITVTTKITTEVDLPGDPQTINSVSSPEEAAEVMPIGVGGGKVLGQIIESERESLPALVSQADITPVGFTRTESSGPDIVYGPGWSASTFSRSSNSDTQRSETAGATLTATVNSEWVGIGFITCATCGEAEIFIDNVSQGIIDTYSRSDDTRAYYYDLGPGLHTINVVVQGARNPFSSNEFVYFDYIDTWDGSALADGFFEQDDSRVYRSNNWGTINATQASSGTYFRDGTSIWFPFTGDSVTFQALAYSGAGQIELRVDDQTYGFVDLYNPTTMTRTYSIDNLGSGIHVLHLRNIRSRATVDGFNSPAVEAMNIGQPQSGIVRYEELSYDLLYNGADIWGRPQSWESAFFSPASRGYAYGTRTGGDSVSLTFDGEWVNVGFITRSRSGLAEIFIDGVSQGTFDTYSRVDGTINFVFDNLAPGTHAIEIRAIDQANPLSSDDYIYLDYIDVWDGTAMPDGTFDAILEPYDGDERIYRSGSWGTRTNAAAINGTFLRDGFSAWFHFVGDSVSFDYLSDSSIGLMEIWIDGVNQGVFDLYNPTSLAGALSFDGLGSGPHVIQIRNYRGRATIDGFTTPGTAPFYTPPVQTGVVRYEDFDPALLYNGVPLRQSTTGWVSSGFSLASRNYVLGTNVGGNSASLSFDGEWVNVGFLTRSRSGLAEIFIDGISQ
ncbi:MAG: transglutaminase domain-containing protein, partial [Chloroflexota bacterium]